MFGYSDKTLQWIFGYLFFNFFVIFYVYMFFHHEWIRTIVSLIIPLLVWEMLTFGILAPDDVFMEIFGENHTPTSSSSSIVPSVRAVVVSSGDC
uniref:Uncharacterized protein n=1 Tax=Caenorhabditis japonica TaxID=281687 RepID=A0A8R1E4S0_CAEJA